MTPLNRLDKIKRAKKLITKTMVEGGDDVIAVHDAYEWLEPDDRREMMLRIYNVLLELEDASVDVLMRGRNGGGFSGCQLTQIVHPRSFF